MKYPTGVAAEMAKYVDDVRTTHVGRSVLSAARAREIKALLRAPDAATRNLAHRMIRQEIAPAILSRIGML